MFNKSPKTIPAASAVGVSTNGKREPIERIMNKGSHVIFDVDVKGGINLKNKFGNRAIALFIMPPSVKELELRLLNRGKDTPEIIKMRIEKAAAEIKLANQFDYVIVNRELDRAIKETVAIISSFLTIH